MYLLDRDNLGGMAQGPGGTDAVLDMAGPYSGVWGKPAFLGTSAGGYVYVVESNGYLRAFKLVKGATGGVSLAAAGTSAGTLGFSSGSPVVTSSGTDGSSALVWVVYVSGGTGAGAELRAYRAIPDNTGNLKEVFNAPLGIGAKFSSVATDRGRVYVGTRDGHVIGFGAPTTSAVGATNTDLGNVQVGSTVTRSVTITASRAVTISSITADAPFDLGAMLTLPRTLAQGGSMTVPVTFSPTAPGQADGTLTVKTADGETDLLGVRGVGTKDGLGAIPAVVQFTDVPTKTVSRGTVNTSTRYDRRQDHRSDLASQRAAQCRPRHVAGRGTDDPAPRIGCGVHDVQSYLGRSGKRFARRRQRPWPGDRHSPRPPSQARRTCKCRAAWTLVTFPSGPQPSGHSRSRTPATSR